jgi:DNA modification methylase
MGLESANTDRKFIGIEMAENYFSIAKKRIESAFMENLI